MCKTCVCMCVCLHVFCQKPRSGSDLAFKLSVQLTGSESQTQLSAPLINSADPSASEVARTQLPDTHLTSSRIIMHSKCGSSDVCLLS